VTKAEYAELYAKARQETVKMSLKAQAKVKRAYIQAAAQAAEKLRDALDRNLSEITVQHWQSIMNELQKASGELNQTITDITTSLVEDSTKVYTKIDAGYLTYAVQSGAITSITEDGILAMASNINRNAVRNMVSRVYSDGYTFSSRVWGLKSDWEKAIKEILTSGIASGRDPVKLVKDIQVYTADGAVALAERWGKLERGSAEWKKRLPKNIDWRAVRLVRSEFQATMQAVSTLAGQTNPGSTGKYTWVLGPGLVHCEHCIEFSTQQFTKDTLPSYPHPNCGCQVRPILQDMTAFVDDLKDWESGKVNDATRRIDTWYQEQYLKVA